MGSNFRPGIDLIPASGAMIGEEEKANLRDVAERGWFTEGYYCDKFAGQLSRFVGTRYAILCNSGSSANLLALTALTAPELGERALRPGDEVITLAAGFPTTVNPIIQNGLVPVFCDIEPGSYNINVGQLNIAISDKTRAVMLAHTLGNPFDVEAVKKFCQNYHLWLIEDCCDALGSEYGGRKCGSFGDLSTFSFFPAHQITTGEGGAVLTNDPTLKRILESFRDWGHDCWCKPGEDNTCNKRFEHDWPGMPQGWDHKYTYTHIGYNLKMTEMQAAIGAAQIDKLPGFIEKRNNNHAYLYARIIENGQDENFLLPADRYASWFGFALTCRNGNEQRQAVMKALTKAKIGVRLLFAGNILRQPAYQNIQFRAMDLSITNDVMESSFWVGVWPGITDEMLDYMAEVLSHA